jgi:hypothetical protein
MKSAQNALLKGPPRKAFAFQFAVDVDAGDDAEGGAFDIAFDARELSGDKIRGAFCRDKSSAESITARPSRHSGA